MASQQEIFIDLNHAESFALQWVSVRQATAAEFVQTMENEFGSTIRMHLIEIVEKVQRELATNSIWQSYFDNTLNTEAIRKTLNHNNGLDTEELSTIDELFTRSKQFCSREGLIEALQFTAKLRKYSPYNNMLVKLQNPYATYYATAKFWFGKFGRLIKEDARSMIILAPMTPVLMVYDVSETTGPELPKWFSRVFEVTGEFSNHVFHKTLDNCVRDKIRVEGTNLGLNVGGVAMQTVKPNEAKMKIKLNNRHGTSSQYATLCHELAHIYLGHLGCEQDKWWPFRMNLTREQKEIEAEAVSYIVCERAGLQTKSDEYLAGYIQDDHDLKRVSLDLIVKVAGRIEKMGEKRLPDRKRN